LGREIFQHCRVAQSHVRAYLDIVPFQSFCDKRLGIRNTVLGLEEREDEH
jgi:hypothetical protein